MDITSPALSTGDTVPERYTCEGRDLSPPLRFEDVPDDASELVLVVDDPDAPNGTFTHWLVWNLDPERRDVEEGASGDLGAREGTNDFGEPGWRGPCPPPEHDAHRYRFTLYAVDEPLDLREEATREQVDAALEGHVMETARLEVRFGR